MGSAPAESQKPLPGPLRVFDEVCGALNHVAEIFVGTLVALMTLDIFVQVVFRYGLESALSWSEELARYLFVWVIFVGVSVAVRRNQHISMTAGVALLPRPARAVMTQLATLAFVGFMVLIGWVSIPLIENARYTVSSELEVPIMWVYAAAPVGALLSVLHLLNNVLQGLWSPPR